MRAIVNAIEEVASTIKHINQAATEQARSIGQLLKTIADMDQSTQQNAETESLNTQAQGLVQLLTRFKTAS